jgi:ABC-type transport system involved in multi-copper enzyme maturation permease subunit
VIAMSWVVWRQYRAAAAITAALVAAFAALIVVTGVQAASQWHSALAACTASRACGNLSSSSLFLGSHAIGFLVIMTLGVPAVLGILAGAPLLAHEFETGTNQYAWTQSVTRRRWLAVKTGWLLLAAAAIAGVVSALVTWWSGPNNALQANAFDPGRFDIMGIVPVGYAVFATALGITAGALLRRTLPAIAVTLAGFIAVRAVIFMVLRRSFMTAVTSYFPIGSGFAPAGSAWQLAAGFVGGDGQPLILPLSTNGAVIGGVGAGVGLPVSSLPAQCQAAAGNGPLTPAAYHAVVSCAQAHGIRGYVTYQPASRYWAFQGIETGIFLLLAAALIAVAFAVVSRRDA